MDQVVQTCIMQYTPRAGVRPVLRLTLVLTFRSRHVELKGGRGGTKPSPCPQLWECPPKPAAKSMFIICSLKNVWSETAVND